MITRVVLGDGTELLNVERVTEIIQSTDGTTYNGMTLDIVNSDMDNSLSVSEIQQIFSRPNVLNNIKVYAKEAINSEPDEEQGEIIEYGEEFLSFETSKYPGIRGIFSDITTKRITIHLSVDPVKLSDDKYNELIEANRNLQLIIDALLGGEDIE